MGDQREKMRPKSCLRNAEARIWVHVARVIAEWAFRLVALAARHWIDRAVQHDDFLVESHLRKQFLRANSRWVGLVHPRPRLRVGGDRDGERDKQKCADVRHTAHVQACKFCKF